MPKSRVVKDKFAPTTSRTSRSTHTLLLQMAKDAERLAEQAARIKELRDERRLTQQPVADAVGVTLRAYQDWEAGRGGINGENVKALAEFFDVTADYIEYGVDKRERGDTPDLSLSRLAGIEATLGELADQVRLLRAETAVRDAEVLKRIEEALPPTQQSPDQPPP